MEAKAKCTNFIVANWNLDRSRKPEQTIIPASKQWEEIKCNTMNDMIVFTIYSYIMFL
jgi:hypothetical protein